MNALTDFLESANTDYLSDAAESIKAALTLEEPHPADYESMKQLRGYLARNLGEQKARIYITRGEDPQEVQSRLHYAAESAILEELLACCGEFLENYESNNEDFWL